MPDLSTVREFNTIWAPAYTPVGIFVGGTSGIGQGITEAFARHTKGNAHIVIVGRSSVAAAAILAGLPPAPTGTGATRDFVQCDLTSIASVKRVAASLSARFPRINLLVTTAGAITFESKITSEGLEATTAVWYYARWALVAGLLPAIRAAHAAGEDARVMAVFSAGHGTALDLGDLGLKKALKPVRDFAGFGVAGGQGSTYVDLMFKDYAARNPGITFVHAHPGLVNTPLLKNAPFTPEILATAKSIEVCGEHQLYALLKAPAGASRTGQDGDNIGMDVPATEEVQRTLWEHTEEVIDLYAGVNAPNSNLLASTSFMRSPAPTSPAAASRLPSSRDPAQRTERAASFTSDFVCALVWPAMPRFILRTRIQYTQSQVRRRHSSSQPIPLCACDTPPSLTCLTHSATLSANNTLPHYEPADYICTGNLSIALSPPTILHPRLLPRRMTPRILSTFATVLYVLRWRPLPSVSHRKTTMLPPYIYFAFHALAIVSRLAWLTLDRDETMYSYCLAREMLELR
ncbi:hypothetical protein K438DRAFT_1972829 [Mycena galopus ATCC 62051]|nr:hypothetical protein K438DRAFT_1972829 [Mycena galopus ATCC 62051]